MSPVIDVHTHMLNNAWLRLLEQHGRPRYTLKAVTGGLLVADDETIARVLASAKPSTKGSSG